MPAIDLVLARSVVWSAQLSSGTTASATLRGHGMIDANNTVTVGQFMETIAVCLILEHGGLDSRECSLRITCDCDRSTILEKSEKHPQDVKCCISTRSFGFRWSEVYGLGSLGLGPFSKLRPHPHCYFYLWKAQQVDRLGWQAMTLASLMLTFLLISLVTIQYNLL